MSDREIRIPAPQVSEQEKSARRQIQELFSSCPIPEYERLANLGLFIKRQDLSRLLFLHDLYKQIVDVPGIVMELGVRWGQTLALCQSFRGIYEPFNHNRKVVGFDTFEGFPAVHEKDGSAEVISAGSFATTRDYELFLDQILAYHEQEAPIGHIKKYELVKGDAVVEVPKYFDQHPETIIAFAYFDLDLYEPTKKCLEIILKHVTKGSVLGFDQLNHGPFPGETLAFKEVFGLGQCRLRRSPYSGVASYLVIE